MRKSNSKEPFPPSGEKPKSRSNKSIDVLLSALIQVTASRFPYQFGGELSTTVPI
jgi:hypothetical protein